jgi:hypothetical protein
MRLAMLRLLTTDLTFLLLVSVARAQTTLSVPPDSPKWDLQGQAEQAEFQGRKCLRLDGGAAVLTDFQFRDGVIDFDVATPAIRGFFGIQFRMADNGANAEEIYLRPQPRASATPASSAS